MRILTIGRIDVFRDAVRRRTRSSAAWHHELRLGLAAGLLVAFAALGRRPGAPPPSQAVERARRTRRHPRPWQFDYLHLRRLLNDLERELGALVAPGGVVLDVYCGSRPYDDLYSPGTKVVGLDIDDSYGMADIVSAEFLPEPDGSYDGIVCIEAWQYVRDPVRGAFELRRVVRPGGRVLVSVPFVWEYDRSALEHRYTAPELVAQFVGWDDVRVVENGGRTVAWTLLTGTLLHAVGERLARGPARAPVNALFGVGYAVVNGLGSALDLVERRSPHPRLRLPANLLLVARRPSDG